MHRRTKNGMYMKLKTLFCFLALLTATTLNAAPGDNNPIILHPTPTTPPEGDRPRSPVAIPVFYLDGYTLTASDHTLGSTVELLDENDNVVFSTYIYIEGDINLPTTLAGTYTIKVTREGQTFIGEIEL